MPIDSFATRGTLRTAGSSWTIFRLDALDGAARLPYSLKVLLENLVRNEDGRKVTTDQITALAQWDSAAEPATEIQFTPARVLMQDFTGVPCLVDLVAMREAMAGLGGDPACIEPRRPVELVIDHSVIADYFGSPEAFRRNVELEYERNRERYQFLRWGQSALRNLRVVPPGTGICHQVNLEYLARVVFGEDGVAFPDTLVGTDSHTPMVNGLGVLGWGVGGIEAEAAMLGLPMSMLIPRVIGVKLAGALPEGSTATDLVLTIAEILRTHGVVGAFVEFYGRRGQCAAGQPGHDRQHEPRVRRHLCDLPDRRGNAIVPAADRPQRRPRGPGRGVRQGTGPVARPRSPARLLRHTGGGPVGRRPVDRGTQAPTGPHRPGRRGMRLPRGTRRLRRLRTGTRRAGREQRAVLPRLRPLLADPRPPRRHADVFRHLRDDDLPPTSSTFPCRCGTARPLRSSTAQW